MDGPIRERITPVAVKAPLNLKDRPEYTYYATEMLTYSIKIYEHHNVYVAHSGVCFSRLGRLLPGSFMQLKRVKRDQQKIALFNLLFRKKKKLDPGETYLVIHNQWSINGYYHWIIDSMPRLWSVRDHLKELCLLLPESARKNNFIQGTLQFFPDLNIEYLESHKVAYAKNLVLPSHLPYWGILEPRYVREFRDHSIAKVSVAAASKFVYVSRRNATRRKILNEDELVQMLMRFGFGTYFLEHLSFEEQVILFKQAKIVVSIHGAALTNLIFMNPGTAVVEFIKNPLSDEAYLMEYQRLASLFNIDYYSCPCQPIPSNGTLDAANLNVNIATVSNLLQQIIRTQE
jgi:capsular polysaccharide biosynthesis protein